ncbi:response regulator transcription factor [Methylomicrobium lacus]|uniref:response regulator transcription factor n=1 Tax=Methylomicrobium lacus TaxID=136992 RepID=UPI0035A8484A
MNNQPNVLLIDDDPSVRESLTLLMETIGIPIQTYDSAEAFLKHYCPGEPGCLILDVNMPGMNGPELQLELAKRKIQLPIIFLTGYGDIPMTVKTIKAGAIDFMIKPIKGKLLIDRIRAIFQQDSLKGAEVNPNPLCYVRMSDLTPREREVMSMVVAGFTNKEIARQLSISHRTVEIHRARVMEKTGASNLLELAHLCEQSRSPSVADL